MLFQPQLFNIVYSRAFVRHMDRTFSKVGKFYFLIRDTNIQFKGFNHISGVRYTSRQIINNEHSKYMEILVLLEQHSNSRLSSAASPVT